MRASKELLAIVFSSLLSVAAAAPSASSSSSANDTKPDYPEAPDFSNDEIQPYPSLKNSDGSYIDIANLRGVRLFGFKGCGTGEGNDITQAYNDFYTLSNQPGYNAIDWDSPAATDFFGPSAGQWRLSDDRRAEIQQIFNAAQQVYSYRWAIPYPPFWWRQLWIEVRCSDGILGPRSTDPQNVCGDAQPNNGRCGANGGPPLGGGVPTLEAFSNPAAASDWYKGKYSTITFCNDFFRLPSFAEANAAARRLPMASRRDLTRWNSKARVFFHEVTHLDYFMNAGNGPNDKSPFVSDLKVRFKLYGVVDWYQTYGPFNAKVLRNYRDPDPEFSGYYTQRNADTYAWFAVARYVQRLIGQYPNVPSPGARRPVEEPQDARGGAPALHVSSGDPVNASFIEGPESIPPPEYFKSLPGCPDKVGADVDAASMDASLSSAYYATASVVSGGAQTGGAGTMTASPNGAVSQTSAGDSQPISTGGSG